MANKHIMGLELKRNFFSLIQNILLYIGIREIW